MPEPRVPGPWFDPAGESLPWTTSYSWSNRRQREERRWEAHDEQAWLEEYGEHAHDHVYPS